MTKKAARTASERFRAGEAVLLEDFLKQGSFPRLAGGGGASGDTTASGGGSRLPALPKRQRVVLNSLRVYGDWARPMDIGARDGSSHTMTLRALVKKGLAERRLRGSLLNQIRGQETYDRYAKLKKRSRSAPRGSYVYRITRKGRDWLLA